MLFVEATHTVTELQTLIVLPILKTQYSSHYKDVQFSLLSFFPIYPWPYSPKLQNLSLYLSLSFCQS